MTQKSAALQPARDDSVMAFEVKPLDVRGRVLRLGAVIDEIISKHDYPDAVSMLLGEAVALAALLGSTLKFDGKLTLQTQTDGPVSVLVADYTTPGQVRGYAHFDKGFDYQNLPADDKTRLTGHGHLALTIDQGENSEQYQGIVALDNQSLSEAADTYFRQSEQLPTAIRLAAGTLAAGGARQWRSGAIMVQHLPAGSDHSKAPEDDSEDDNWTKARLLLETVKDHELLDPMLAPEELLYRLYHEDGVTVYPARPIIHKCTCSRQRVAAVLAGFSQKERADMAEDGKITTTCQFCSARYSFDSDEIKQA